MELDPSLPPPTTTLPPLFRCGDKDQNGSGIPRESGEEKGGHCGEVVTVHTARAGRGVRRRQKAEALCLTAGESVAHSCLNVMVARNGSYEPQVRSAHYMLMTWNTDSRAEAQTAN